MKQRKILSLLLILTIIASFTFTASAEDIYPDACISIPNKATLFLGEKTDVHFVDFTEISPIDKTETEEKNFFYFELENDKTYNYRITSENHITYAGIFTKTPDFSLDITEEMLNESGNDKALTDRNLYSNNGFNVADIYLNINPQGYLKLNNGDTYQIVNLRNWETVNSTSANYFIEPDYHYQVINESGLETDIITIDENGLITANKSGTAIVLVTYDAINLNYGEQTEFYGAIWPENTGVFVVGVDTTDSQITTNMTLNEGKNSSDIKLSGDLIDAEHDCIYFTGENGNYTFTPETENCSVFVANPIIDSKLSYNGFNEVLKSEDNSFTLPLVEGRNIIKITSGEFCEYQIITAKKVNITINDGNEVKPGDSLNIVFDTLYHPANKLAGVYNMSVIPLYTEVSGYEEKNIGSVSAQYDFSSNTEAQSICNVLKEDVNDWGLTTYEKGDDLIIPVDYAKDTFTLTGGSLCVSGYGDEYGNHRGITYESGKAPNFSADAKLAWLGKLPDIVIPVKLPEENDENGDISSPDTIEVTFSLLGDEKHESTLEKHTMKNGNLQKWIDKISITIDEGSFVIDAVKKALDDANIQYTYNGYLSSVKGLNEMDNGTNSGWLYMLNGEYTLYGMNEQKLENGDEIIVHYTDDFMVEFASEDEKEDETETDTPSNSSSGGSGKKKKATSFITAPIMETPKEAPIEFKDIEKNSWYSEAVKYVTEKQIMNGVSNNEFAPDDFMTRAMLVTVLYRMENSKTVDKNTAFSDIENNSWYTDAVIWAYENKIVNGVSDTLFAPNENVSREQLATIICRYAQFKNISTEINETNLNYSDAKNISEWANSSMKWAINNGIINGTSEYTLSPSDNTTRSQVAVILMRFIENILKTK